MFLVAVLAGCAPSYSADEYAARAVQQANPVQQGIVAGSRRVAVAADGTTGAAAGAGAGGAIGGAAVAGNTVSTALGAVGGALVGGLVGSAAERAAANTNAIEYIVRKTNGDLVSVTQRDEVPIPLGARVLVIAGAQARVVPDYTDTQTDPAPASSGGRRGQAPRPASAPSMPGEPAASPAGGTAPLPDAPHSETLPDLSPASEGDVPAAAPSGAPIGEPPSAAATPAPAEPLPGAGSAPAAPPEAGLASPAPSPSGPAASLAPIAGPAIR